MKLSIFVCIVNPEYWCFPYLEAIQSYCDFADEVIVIDSHSTDGSLEKVQTISPKIKIIQSDWPWDFTQKEYPIHYNLGFESCTGDWVMKMDIDHLLDSKYLQEFKERLAHAGSVKMATFQRWNFLNRYQFYDKGKMPTAINKKFDVKVGIPRGESNTDWTIPVENYELVDGVPLGDRINPSHILNTGIPIFNYDCFFRDKEKCKVWYQRIANANPQLYGASNAWERWKEIRLKQKTEPGLKTITLNDHPMRIRERVNNMTPEMWGFNNWNWEL